MELEVRGVVNKNAWQKPSKNKMNNFGEIGDRSEFAYV